MTPRVRAWPYRKVARLLRRAGFERVGQRGSHVYFRHPDGRKVTVPRHDGQDIGAGLMRDIAKQAGIDPDTLRR